MGRSVIDHDPVRPPVPGPVRPIMMPMAMTFPVTMPVPVSMTVSVSPSVTPGAVAVFPGRTLRRPAVMGVPPPVGAVDTFENDPDGQGGKGAGEQTLCKIVGVPPVVPVVGRCAQRCDQQG